jgi:hypothetical protein
VAGVQGPRPVRLDVQGLPGRYLLFWFTGAEMGARQIGTDAKETAPRLLIVDGQQRLTSLFVVLSGRDLGGLIQSQDGLTARADPVSR